MSDKKFEEFSIINNKRNNIEKQHEFQDSDLKKTVLERNFNDAERSSRKLYEYLLKIGKVKIIGGEYDYDEHIKGYPELKEDVDGFLFPIKAVINLTIEKKKLFIEINNHPHSSLDYITVRIHAEVSDLNIAREILAACHGDLIIIEKKIQNLNALGQFFHDLQESALIAEIKANEKAIPKVKLDPKYGLIPENVILVLRDGNNIVKYHFKSKFGNHIIEVECALNQVPRVKRLLNDYFKDHALSEQETTLLEPLNISPHDWEELGGIEPVKRTLKELIEYPLMNPELYDHLRISPPKGILLIGPPGTGKTTIAKIIASNTQALFYYVSPKDINSMWYGKSEQNIARLFREVRAASAENDKPAILFFDELDGFYSERSKMHETSRRTFGQLCTELDGMETRPNLIILGATNRFEDLDPALTRPGRFDRKIMIGLPDSSAREAIFKIHLKGRPLAADVIIKDLMSLTKELSGAQIAEICQKATFTALRRFSERTGISIANIQKESFNEIRIDNSDLITAINQELASFKKS